MNSKNTVFLLCDIQEKFRSHIFEFNHIVSTANKLCAASKILSIPLVVTEQHPKGLGKTAIDVDVSFGKVFEKTQFSMLTPEVKIHLDGLGRKNVVLFGIEVKFNYSYYLHQVSCMRVANCIRST